MRIVILIYFVLCGVNTINGQEHFPAGEVVDTIRCQNHPEHSYSIYLPSSYHPSRSWPVIFIYDAAGRGKNSAEIFRLAGETHGYIIVGSHNFRNGPFDIGATAIDILFEDVPTRFSIDPQKIYTAGLSGGARMAAATAVLADRIAGVIAFAAGMHPNFPIKRDSKFAWVGVAGNQDMNYAEMVTVQKKLENFGIRNMMITYAGRHGWPPDNLIADACGWMKLLTSTLEEQAHEKPLTAFLDTLIHKAEKNHSSGRVKQSIYALRSISQYIPKSGRIELAKAMLDEYMSHPETQAQLRMSDSLQTLELHLQSEVNEHLTKLSDVDPYISVLESKEKIRDFIYAEKLYDQPNVQNVYNRLLGHVALFTFTNGNPLVFQEEYPKAVPYMEVWQASHPESESMALYLAKVYALAGKSGKAVKMFREALAHGLDDPGLESKKEILTYLRDKTQLAKVGWQTAKDWL